MGKCQAVGPLWRLVDATESINVFYYQCVNQQRMVYPLHMPQGLGSLSSSDYSTRVYSAAAGYRYQTLD